jgi:hypothetical protein
MKKIFGLLLICTLGFFSCEDVKKVVTKPVVTENKIATEIKHKIAAFKKAPERVEVRNYLKGAHHKYQDSVKIIKKIKTPLNPKSDVYLELNLFTNEQDKNAPLVVQFMWFDVKTKNLILEENLNLD